MKRLKFFVLMLCLIPSLAIAADSMKSRFGNITLTEVTQDNNSDSFFALRKYLLKLDGKIIYQTEESEYITISLCKLFKVGDKDVLLLVSSQGGSIGAEAYWFMTIDNKGIKETKIFVAPGVLSLLNIKQNGNKIEVNYDYSKDKGMTRPPVVYENGVIRTQDKITRRKKK